MPGKDVREACARGLFIREGRQRISTRLATGTGSPVPGLPRERRSCSTKLGSTAARIGLRGVLGQIMSVAVQTISSGRLVAPSAIVAFTLCTSACAAPRAHSPTIASASSAYKAVSRVPGSALAAVPIANPLPPDESPVFSQTGPASWYRPKLQRRTASGEAFDAAAFTAAHRSLPFGTIVRVTCPSTGRTIKVRVNDRGPFTHGRVLDISAAAAETLGIVQYGEATVLIEEYPSDQL